MKANISTDKNDYKVDTEDYPKSISIVELLKAKGEIQFTIKFNGKGSHLETGGTGMNEPIGFLTKKLNEEQNVEVSVRDVVNYLLLVGLVYGIKKSSNVDALNSLKAVFGDNYTL